MTRILLATLAAAAVLIAACGPDTTAGPSPTPAAPLSTTTPAPATTDGGVPAELRFTASTVDGEEFNGESLLGTPAVLWFWAPWCPTCRREAPMVGRIADQTADVTFLGVAAMDQLPAMQRFIDTFPVAGFPHLADTEGAVWAKFGVTRQPAYAFVSPDGVVDVLRGQMSESELTERVAALSSQ